MNNNTLEFFVKMKDMMSGGLVKLAATTKQTFTKMQQAVDTATTKIGLTAQKSFTTASTASYNYRKTLGSLYDKMNDLKKFRMDEALGTKEIKQASAEIRKLQGEIGKLEGRSGGNGVMGFLKKGLAFAGVGLSLSSAFGFAKESVGAANQFESQKKSYGVLTGNQGVGNELSSQLRGLKENTIMGPAVYQNAQTMLAFGIAAKDVVNDVRMLGDVSMGDANKLQHLTLAFSEVQAAGKLTAKEVRMMSYQGFNPLQEISRTTGQSMEDLRKKMHDGGVSAEMVTHAFKTATGEGGRFNNMLNQMATTSAGKLALLQGRVASLKIAFGERLQPAVNAAVDSLTSLVTTVKHWLDVPVAKQVDEQINKIQSLQLKLTSLTTTESGRVSVLKELEQINPNIVKGINAQSIEYGKLQENINGVIGALNQKKIADRFQKDGADTIYNYNKAMRERGDNMADITSLIAYADSSLSGRTDLSFGQKQQAAVGALTKTSILSPSKYSTQYSGGFGVITHNGITEVDQKNDLINAIKNYNVNNDLFGKLTPAYNKIQNDIKGATDAYNKVFGLDNMVTAAGIKPKDDEDGGGGSGGGSGGKSGKDKVAESITGGGPRTININGVNMKLAENIHVTSSDAQGILDELEPKMQKMFLRILNSGASIQ